MGRWPPPWQGAPHSHIGSFTIKWEPAKCIYVNPRGSAWAFEGDVSWVEVIDNLLMMGSKPMRWPKIKGRAPPNQSARSKPGLTSPPNISMCALVFTSFLHMLNWASNTSHGMVIITWFVLYLTKRMGSLISHSNNHIFHTSVNPIHVILLYNLHGGFGYIRHGMVWCIRPWFIIH